MEPYIELIFAAGERDELLQAALYDFEPQGIVEDDLQWKAYFTKQMWSGQGREMAAALEEIEPGITYSVNEVQQQNWNAIWEASIQPVHVSNRIVIAPSWSGYAAQDNEIVIVIDPKMSFGTGFHESTRLMIRLIERWIREGARAIDVGTGTGVLAIAAVKLGASHAIGVDIDEWAEDNAGENIERNDVRDQVEIYIGSVERAEGTFDLILSNITRNDNIALLPEYAKMLNPGGRLILSGLYVHDEEAVLLACSRYGFEKADEEIENEWIALTFTAKV